jgi:hypothetical protein
LRSHPGSIFIDCMEYGDDWVILFLHLFDAICCAIAIIIENMKTNQRTDQLQIAKDFRG